MHVLLSFLKWGSIDYSLGIVQWDFTRRDHPRNPRRVFGSGPVTLAQMLTSHTTIMNEAKANLQSQTTN